MTNTFRGKGLTQREVLCDDLLVMILKTLSAEDVWRLQRVSQQFSDCVEEVLRSVRAVEMVDRNGFNSTGAQRGVYNISKCLTERINSKESRNNLKSVAIKCPFIHKLFVDHRVSAFSLTVFGKRLEALNEIHLGPTFLSQKGLKLELIVAKLRTNVKTMNLWFSHRIQYHWQSAENQRNQTILLVSGLPNLKSLFVYQNRQWFENIWDFLPIDMNEVSVENYMYVSNDTLEAIQSQSLHSYLNRCGSGPQNIWTTIGYSVEDLTLIALKCELKKFCLNCRLLSVHDLLTFLESTHTLKILCVIELNESTVMPKQKPRNFSSIKALTLKNVRINKQNVKYILQCFSEVEILFLFDTVFVCDCPQPEGLNQNIANTSCKPCGAECLSWLSSLQHLKDMTLGRMAADLVSLDSFNSIKCLNVFESTNETIAYKLMKYNELIDVCKHYCLLNPTKGLAINVFDDRFVDKESIFEDIPQNLKLFLKKSFNY